VAAALLMVVGPLPTELASWVWCHCISWQVCTSVRRSLKHANLVKLMFQRYQRGRTRMSTWSVQCCSLADAQLLLLLAVGRLRTRPFHTSSDGKVLRSWLGSEARCCHSVTMVTGAGSSHPIDKYAEGCPHSRVDSVESLVVSL